MNTQNFLAMTIFVMLAGCDTSATLGTDLRRAGTSSETQTSLQALADSIAELRFAQKKNEFAARQQDPTMTPVGNLRAFAYITGMWATISYDTDSLFLNNSASSVQSERMINTNVDYYTLMVYPTQSPLASAEGFGEARSGFKFSFRTFDDSDRVRLNYQTTQITSEYQCWNDILFRLGNRWETIFPGSDNPPLEKLPIFENSKQVGWLINPALHSTTGGGPRYVFFQGFNGYQVTDMLGYPYFPTPLKTTKHWIFDSLGVFADAPYPDSTGEDLLMPYRWSFLPGTAQIIQHSKNAAIAEFEKKDAADLNHPNGQYPVEISFPSDTGCGIARIKGGAKFTSSATGAGVKLLFGAYVDTLTNKKAIISAKRTDIDVSKLPIPIF